MPHGPMWEHIHTERRLYPCGLPCSCRMVWCGLQCTAPMAFPAQLFHRPWRTQVAVMTEDARLVALHSLDTVAPIVAPSPASPLTKARICRADIWSFKIFLSKFKKKKRRENCCRLANYTVDMCFIEMIYRQDISCGQWWTQGSQSEIVKGACVDS